MRGGRQPLSKTVWMSITTRFHPRLGAAEGDVSRAPGNELTQEQGAELARVTLGTGTSNAAASSSSKWPRTHPSSIAGPAPIEANTENDGFTAVAHQ